MSVVVYPQVANLANGCRQTMTAQFSHVPILTVGSGCVIPTFPTERCPQFLFQGTVKLLLVMNPCSACIRSKVTLDDADLRAVLPTIPPILLTLITPRESAVRYWWPNESTTQTIRSIGYGSVHVIWHANAFIRLQAQYDPISVSLQTNRYSLVKVCPILPMPCTGSAPVTRWLIG